MGQCLSAGAGRAGREARPNVAGVAVRLPEPEQLEQQQHPGVSDRAIYPVVEAAQGGLQLAVSQARCAADAGSQATPLLVRQTPQHTFIALFEGQGRDPHSVADFCRSRVLELFQESWARHMGSPLEALRDTLERLDAAIFATNQLKQAAKADSGASCVLLLVELASQRCYCANVGTAACLLSRISGSFNAKQPEGFFLTCEHTTRSKEEMVRQQRRVAGEATPPHPGGSVAAPACASDAVQLGQHTRALGFMDVKRKAGGSGTLLCEPHVSDHTLTGTDQCLVVATSAFWQLVGPTDCALRAHFHEKFARRELERAQAAAAAGAQEAPSPSLAHATNTAEHLVYWALEKATRKLARLQKQQQGQHSGTLSSSSSVLPPSVADVLALPFQQGPAAEPLGGSGPVPAQGGQNEQQQVQQLQQQLQQAAEQQEAVQPEQQREPEQQQQQQPEQQRELDQQQPLPPLVRSDVYGNLGVVVVTLRRQDNSLDAAAMRDIMAAIQARRSTAAAAATGSQQRAGAAAGGQGGGGGGAAGYVARLTQRRWDQVRMLVDFHKAHRRVLLRQWWEAQDALYRRSRIAGVGAGRISLFASSQRHNGVSPGKLAVGAAAAAAAARRGSGVGSIGAGAGAAAGSKAARDRSSNGGGGIKAVRPGGRQ